MDKKLNEHDIRNFLIILIPDAISQENFNKSIFVMVKKLYDYDNQKYFMIMHIADKVSQESNRDIFDLNFNDFLKNEVKLWL